MECYRLKESQYAVVSPFLDEVGLAMLIGNQNCFCIIAMEAEVIKGFCIIEAGDELTKINVLLVFDKEEKAANECRKLLVEKVMELLKGEECPYLSVSTYEGLDDSFGKVLEKIGFSKAEESFITSFKVGDAAKTLEEKKAMVKDNGHVFCYSQIDNKRINAFNDFLRENDLFYYMTAGDILKDNSTFYISDDENISGCFLIGCPEDSLIEDRKPELTIEFMYSNPKVNNAMAFFAMMSKSITSLSGKYPDDTKVSFYSDRDNVRAIINKLNIPDTKNEKVTTYLIQVNEDKSEE